MNPVMKNRAGSAGKARAVALATTNQASAGPTSVSSVLRLTAMRPQSRTGGTADHQRRQVRPTGGGKSPSAAAEPKGHVHSEASDERERLDRTSTPNPLRNLLSWQPKAGHGVEEKDRSKQPDMLGERTQGNPQGDDDIHPDHQHPGHHKDPTAHQLIAMAKYGSDNVQAPYVRLGARKRHQGLGHARRSGVHACSDAGGYRVDPRCNGAEHHANHQLVRRLREQKSNRNHPRRQRESYDLGCRCRVESWSQLRRGDGSERQDSSQKEPREVDRDHHDTEQEDATAEASDHDCADPGCDVRDDIYRVHSRVIHQTDQDASGRGEEEGRNDGDRNESEHGGNGGRDDWRGRKGRSQGTPQQKDGSRNH